jgi:hypothetical protein
MGRVRFLLKVAKFGYDSMRRDDGRVCWWRRGQTSGGYLKFSREVLGWCIVTLLLLTSQGVRGSSVLYDFSLIARQGMTTVDGYHIEGISPEVSVNEYGNVAFIATMGPGSNLMVGRDTNSLRNISRSTDARFYGFPQINNQNVVVTRELMGGGGVVRTWRASNPGEFTILASTALSQFTQFTVPTLGNTDLPEHHPLVGFLGRVSDLPFAYFANATGIRNDQNQVSGLAGGTLTSFRALAAHSGKWVFTAQYSTADDHGRVVALVYDEDLCQWEEKLIATTASGTNWGWVGVSPGISDSGKVIAFVGEHAVDGEGIFAAFENSFATAAAPKPLLVLGTNSVIAYDEDGKPITLKSFDRINRVAVMHEELGRAGLLDDVVTICFIATPQRASRTNAHLAGTPLLFSARPGIWTLRVDIDRNLAPPTGLILNRATPVAVVQAGDRIDGATVSALSLYDPLSSPLVDKHGVARVPNKGDHYLAFSAVTDAGVKVVRAAWLDSDGDGLMDYWETYGLDMDRDGVVDLNLRELGANPQRKDIFLEIDWTVPRRDPGDRAWTNAPPPGVVQRMVQMFAEAPLTNLNMSTGVVLHVDAGPNRDAVGNPYSVNMGTRRAVLGGGNQIGMVNDALAHPDLIHFGFQSAHSIPGVLSRSLTSIKDEFCGNRDKGAREFAFKYAVLGDFNGTIRASPAWTNLILAVQAADTNYVLTSTLFPSTVEDGHSVKIISGKGAGQVRTIWRVDIVARDYFEVDPPWSVTPDATSRLAVLHGAGGRGEVTFRSGPNFHSLGGNDYVITKGGFGVNPGGWLSTGDDFWRTLSHELGHTLGLRHGGTDHTNDKIAYLSIMNYRYSGAHTNFSGASDPVFDDWAYVRYWHQNNGYIMGNAFSLNPVGAAWPDDPDPNIKEYEQLLGHRIDLEAPAVVITAPTNGATVGAGADFEVRALATDNAGIRFVIICFDVDGDGVCAGSAEEVRAIRTPDGFYSAVFHGVGGPKGVRQVSAVAEDTAGNQGVSAVRVNAGSTGATGAILQQGSGVFAAQGAGGKQQTARVGPVAIPGTGQLMISLTATPAVGTSGGGSNCLNSTIRKIELQGEEYLGWTPSGLESGGQALSTAYWSAPGAGSLYVEIAGPAFESATGAFLGSPQQSYSYVCTFRPVDMTPPEASVLSPSADDFVGLGETLLVRLNVTDDYTVTGASASFDINGDGDRTDAGESVSCTLESPGIYRAEFLGVGGSAGTRPIYFNATDAAGLVTQQMTMVEVRAPDTVPPTLSITAPEPGARVQRGTIVSVVMEAGDDRGLNTVTATLDVDGNGAINGATETVVATKKDAFVFEAEFPAVSGPSEARMISVVARDTSGNTNLVVVPITVGGVETNAASLTNQTGSLPAQGSQWVGGKRQVVNLGPIMLPSAGTLRFVVSAKPNCRIVGQTTARYDPVVDQVVLNGKTFNTVQSWNALGSNPAIGTSTLVVTEPGSISFRILGAAVYNIWGEFSGSPAQDYTLDVQLEAFDNVLPDVAFSSPALGANVELGKPLTTEVTVSDAGGVASVLLFFDTNGDGDTEDLGEMQAAQKVGDTTYRANFPAVSGPPATRSIRVLATDTSLNTTTKSMTVGCGGVGAGETVLFARTALMTNSGARQTIKFGPLNVTGVGRLTMSVVSTPNTRQAVENLTRYDTAVRAVTFNGTRTVLTPTCNAPGSNPAECSSVWDSPGAGTLEVELVGPAVYNSWGEYSGHPPTTYALEVLFRAGPTVTSVLPASGVTAGGQTVEVSGGGFSLNPTVLFNNVAAQNVLRLSATKISCVTPPGAAGSAAVTVINSDSEGSPWNYGAPYSLFGRLSNGYQYVAPSGQFVVEGERFLGSYSGHFDAVAAEQPQREQTVNFSIPGEGRLRFSAYAFVPILNALPGPFEDPDDLSYHNESTAVRRFYGADGWPCYPAVESSDLTYPFGPVVTEATAGIGKSAVGAGRFVITGPARWNAFWRQFDEFEMISAPAQDWSVAVWFAARPGLISISPATGQSLGGTLVTVTGSNLVDVATVRFGGQPATDLYLLSSSTLTCRTPAGLQGVVDVELEFAGMKSVLARAFTATEFRVTSILPPSLPGGAMTIRVPTESGRRYQLQRSVDLRSPSWLSVGQIVSGDGTTRALVDPTTPVATPYAFYRILVLP